MAGTCVAGLFTLAIKLIQRGWPARPSVSIEGVVLPISTALFWRFPHWAGHTERLLQMLVGTA
eukprot:7387959-Prymnesium_polylepis.3